MLPPDAALQGTQAKRHRLDEPCPAPVLALEPGWPQVISGLRILSTGLVLGFLLWGGAVVFHLMLALRRAPLAGGWMGMALVGEYIAFGFALVGYHRICKAPRQAGIGVLIGFSVFLTLLPAGLLLFSLAGNALNSPEGGTTPRLMSSQSAAGAFAVASLIVSGSMYFGGILSILAMRLIARFFKAHQLATHWLFLLAYWTGLPAIFVMVLLVAALSLPARPAVDAPLSPGILLVAVVVLVFRGIGVSCYSTLLKRTAAVIESVVAGDPTTAD